MQNQKTVLVTKMNKIDEKILNNYSKYNYSKFVIFYDGNKEIDIKNKTLLSKFEIIKINNLIELNNHIKNLQSKYLEYKLIPDFAGDANSKYNIRIFNKTYGNKIDYKIFREKDIMGKFLEGVSDKKQIRISYKELISSNYQIISKNLTNETFIIKPTNAASSLGTFKVNSEEQFENIKTKIPKGYDYVIEEYILGELYSMDFFFDGEKMFLLVYAREVAMIEMSDKNKFSKDFLEKYGEEIGKHFNFILPLAYNLDFKKLSKIELNFLNEISKRLKEINFVGNIHLEYKYDKEKGKIGFLEWGARYGGYRKIFMKKIYNVDNLKLQYEILIEKSFSKFKKINNFDIYEIKEQEHDVNYVRIKTNFINKINKFDILKKTGDIMKNSFHSFILDYYKNKFGIKINNLDFVLKTTKDGNFYPFYEKQSCRFDYIIELDDENFKLFKSKKFKIIEQIFFHDYK